MKATGRSAWRIIEVNGQHIAGAADLERVYGEIGEGETFILKLRRPDRDGVIVTALAKPRS